MVFEHTFHAARSEAVAAHVPAKIEFAIGLAEGPPLAVFGPSSVAHAAQDVIRHPDHWDLLQNNPDLVPVAIEEMLGKKVFLRSFVKVVAGWTEDPEKVRRFTTEGTPT